MTIENMEKALLIIACGVSFLLGFVIGVYVGGIQ